MNPRRLSMWVSAIERANATELFKAMCFVDPPSLQVVSNHLHGSAAGTPMDLSVASDWDDVFFGCSSHRDGRLRSLRGCLGVMSRTLAST
jgi:hypothetical protein